MPTWSNAYQYAMPAIVLQAAQEILGALCHTRSEIPSDAGYAKVSAAKSSKGNKGNQRPEKIWTFARQIGVVRAILVTISWCLMIVATDMTMTSYGEWSKSTRQGYIVTDLLMLAATGIAANALYSFMIAGRDDVKWYAWIGPLWLSMLYLVAWHLFGQILSLSRSGLEESLAYTGTALVPLSTILLVVIRDAEAIRFHHLLAYLVFYLTLATGWVFVAISVCLEPE